MFSQFENALRKPSDSITGPSTFQSLLKSAAGMASAALLLAPAANAQILCDPCVASLPAKAGPATIELSDWMVPSDTDEIEMIGAPQHGTWAVAQDPQGRWFGEYTPSDAFATAGMDQVTLLVGTVSNLDEGQRTLILQDTRTQLTYSNSLVPGSSYDQSQWSVVGVQPLVTADSIIAFMADGTTSAMQSGSGDNSGDSDPPPVMTDGTIVGPQNSDNPTDPFAERMLEGTTRIFEIVDVVAIEAEVTDDGYGGWTMRTRAVAADGTFGCGTACATPWLDTPDSASKTLRVQVGPESIVDGTADSWKVYFTIEETATGDTIANGSASLPLAYPNANFPNTGILSVGAANTKVTAGPADGEMVISFEEANHSIYSIETHPPQTLIHADFETRAAGSVSSALDESSLTEEGPLTTQSMSSLNGTGVTWTNISKVFDLYQVNAVGYPAGYIAPVHPDDRATLSDYTLNDASEVKIQFQLDTSAVTPVATYIWVAEIGRNLSMTNVGPARILMMTGHNGKRFFRIRTWNSDFTLVQSAWMEAASADEMIAVHWAADTSNGAAPNGFVHLQVGDRSIAVENLDNGALRAKWAAVGSIAHSFASQVPVSGMNIEIDDLAVSYR